MPFYNVRYNLYIKRKYQLNKLNNDKLMAKQKYQYVISTKIVIYKIN